MDTRSPGPDHGPSRRRLLLRLLALHLVLGALLRAVCWFALRPGGPEPLGFLGGLSLGVLRDLCVAPFVLAPVAALLGLLPARLWSRRFAVGVLAAACVFGLLFDAVVQGCFFEEFTARYNHVAVDYVLYPHEVLVNLQESYPVGTVVFLCSVCAVVAARFLVRGLPAPRKLAFKAKAAWSGGWILACAAGVAVLVALPAKSFADRVSDEVSHNGHEQLWRAYLTSELDYEAYYATLPREEAVARARRLLGFDGTAEGATGDAAWTAGMTKAVRPSVQPTRPLDVVVVLEESLGSDFSKAYGGKQALTPRLDEWSARGLMVRNLVANGNRTVRGLEGVLCSFVPLPGDSITKRPATRETATLAAAYARCGYETAFFYGGRGMFDSLEPFASQNGWQAFVQQRDMPDDAFYTAWGAADEFVFDMLVERQKAARAAGKPLFATMLSVSNHKPYLVPERDTGLATVPASRGAAVAYADWSLGRWLDRCRDEGLLEHTVVLVVGDHGARVYGAESIPVGSYRIPALFLSPDAAWQGKTVERLCSQVDLAPTLLSLSGVAARASFFGEDLTTRLADAPGRAFVIHNRNIGLLTDRWMVVLGLQKEIGWWKRADRASNTYEEVPRAQVPEDLREMERDATAVFQLADQLYRRKGLVVESAQAAAGAR